MDIRVFGGNKNFISLLERIGSVKHFDDLSEALALEEKEPAVLFILPQYEKGEYFIPELDDGTAKALFDIIRREKTKIFIENYPAYDYRDCFILGLQARSLLNNIGKFSICLTGSYKDRLGFEILQKRSGFYYPAAPHTDDKSEILAEIRNCLGTHLVIEKSDREGVALLKTQRGVYCSMADLTDLGDKEIFSFGHWRDFYSLLLEELTGVSAERIKAEFALVYEGIGISKNKRSKDLGRALEDAVKKAVLWHERSGIMPSGGRGGVYEMFRSFDLRIAKNLRADSSLFTAALFMAAGKYFGNEEYEKVARTLADLMLKERALQIRSGNNKGLFKWFSGIGDLGAKSVYVSDSSRVGNSVIALFRLTENEEYKKIATSLGDALLGWFGGEGLLPGCLLNYEKEDVISVQNKKRSASPEFYDAPLIFLYNLYTLTNDYRYKDQIIKTAEALSNIYPSFEAVASHSDNFTYSRLLGALAAAQKFGDGVWTKIIDELLAYFKKQQHTVGGFWEGRAYFDKDSLGRDMEFSVGFGKDDKIADLVYCQNTLAYALNILLSAEGSFDRVLAKELYSSLIDFLLDSQIASSDPRFDGAWMRAFDMDNMEYYGCDKDFAWGPYCILTGWVTGAIPLVFLDILGLKTMY